jgi:hypothetical protein
MCQLKRKVRISRHLRNLRVHALHNAFRDAQRSVLSFAACPWPVDPDDAREVFKQWADRFSMHMPKQPDFFTSEMPFSFGHLVFPGFFELTQA